MRVLFLTHRLPYAPNRGDRIRAYHFLTKTSQFATVDLFSFVNEKGEEGHTGSVPVNGEVAVTRLPRMANMARAAATLGTRRPLTHALLDAPDASERIAALVAGHRPDVVLAYCTGMARFALQGALRQIPFVLDFVDVDSVKWRDYAAQSGVPRRWIYAREAATLQSFEAHAARRAQVSLVVSERERGALLDFAPDARVTVVPVGVDTASLAPPDAPGPSSNIVFCGVMDYFPNVQGARWLGERVWPLVRRARPDARLVIVGSNPTRAVRQLALRDASIEVTGWVADVRPYLWSAAAAVAPLLVARGVQTKVLEAIASGLPVVITPGVHGGLPPDILRACETAGTPEAFAAALLRLLDLNPDARRRRAATAPSTSLSWQHCLEPLEQILRAAAARRVSVPIPFAGVPLPGSTSGCG